MSTADAACCGTRAGTSCSNTGSQLRDCNDDHDEERNYGGAVEDEQCRHDELAALGPRTVSGLGRWPIAQMVRSKLTLFKSLHSCYVNDAVDVSSYLRSLAKRHHARSRRPCPGRRLGHTAPGGRAWWGRGAKTSTAPVVRHTSPEFCRFRCNLRRTSWAFQGC